MKTKGLKPSKNYEKGVAYGHESTLRESIRNGDAGSLSSQKMAGNRQRVNLVGKGRKEFRAPSSDESMKSSAPGYKEKTYPEFGGKLFKKPQRSTFKEAYVRGDAASPGYAKDYQKGSYTNRGKVDKGKSDIFERDQPSIKDFKSNVTRIKHKDAGASLRDMGISPEVLNEVKKRYKK